MMTMVMIVGAAGGAAAQEGERVEEGRFLIHKLQQRVGAESYEVRRAGGVVVTTAKSELTFLGEGAPLTATLRASADGTPLGFAVKGRTSTLTRTDNAVEVRGSTASVRRGREAAREVPCRGASSP